jgi:hypothetical protein
MTPKNANGRLPPAVRQVVLAIALSMCLGACEPEGMALPPWHMWGAAKRIDVVSAGASGQGTSEQLVRINYGRPETWRFFLAAQTLEGTAAAGSLIVAFNTTLGVGRSSVTVPLGVFNFVFAGAMPKTIKFASTSLGPLVDDAQAAVPNLLDTIVAQDIQVQAQVVLVDAVVGHTASVQCTALFAPEGHVRPEWFKEHFPGGEDKGL